MEFVPSPAFSDLCAAVLSCSAYWSADGLERGRIHRALRFGRDHELQRCMVCKVGHNEQSTIAVAPSADELQQAALGWTNGHLED